MIDTTLSLWTTRASSGHFSAFDGIQIEHMVVQRGALGNLVHSSTPQKHLLLNLTPAQVWRQIHCFWIHHLKSVMCFLS